MRKPTLAFRCAALCAAVCAALLALSCASQKEADGMTFDTAPLFGMIYDADNQPCAGVQLSVDGSNGLTSDIRGRFVVPDLTRGTHTVMAAKSGYEQLAVDVAFLNRTDVLHMQMTSFGQLLQMAQEALRDTRWAEAEGFLQRAEKLDPSDAVLRYLYAVHAYRTGAFAAAVDYLDAIESSGAPQPAVLLLQADIYETRLGEPDKAVAALQEYLRLRDDPEVEKRLERLKGQDGEGGAL